MAVKENISKVIYGDTVLIDLTADTVSKDKILTNFTAHDKTGAVITGECSFDVDSQDATVKVAEILDGKTAYARGAKLEGTMPNNGAVSLTISNVNDEVSIAQGYHDGSGKVSILNTEKANIIAENIRQGITILGVKGNLKPSSAVIVQSTKTVTPSKISQTITPDSGFNALAQVIVKAIPYAEVGNSAGGKTVTIG